MILNRTAGGQKKYHILNQNVQVWFNSEYAEAGQIVGIGTDDKFMFDFGESFVKTASGTMIPMGEGKVVGVDRGARDCLHIKNPHLISVMVESQWGVTDKLR